MNASEQKSLDTYKTLQLLSEIDAEAALRYQADSGGGAVTATVDGRGTLVGIKIQPDATEDVELLEDLVTSAVRAASAKAQQAAQQDLAAMTGGMNIPGLSDLLGGPGGAAVG